jgi:hypothetical protein
MASDQSFLQEESFHASRAPHSHRLLDDSLTTHLCQYLIFGRAEKYNCAYKALQPMMLTIPLKDTVVTLHQLHPLPLTLPFHLFFTISIKTFLSWIRLPIYLRMG